MLSPRGAWLERMLWLGSSACLDGERQRAALGDAGDQARQLAWVAQQRRAQAALRCLCGAAFTPSAQPWLHAPQ